MSSRLKDKELYLIKTVIQNILRYKLIVDGDTVLVGLSGGPDSVFLLKMLLKCREILIKDNIYFNIMAAHVNHKIREEAGYDQNLAKTICEKNRIDFYFKEIDVEKLAKKEKISIEECGRNVRYDFFKKLCEKNKISKIAVAHNMEDNAETIIMNFIRGAGINGLNGMEYITDNIIRPILNISKKDILEYLNNNNIPFAIDKTNSENDYTRNKIRNVLLPQLKEYNPNIIQTLNNSAFILKDEEKIITDIVQQRAQSIATKNNEYETIIKLEDYRNLKEYEKRIVIKSIIEKILKDKRGISFMHIDEIVKLLDEHKKGKTFEIANRYCLQILNKNEAIIKRNNVK